MTTRLGDLIEVSHGFAFPGEEFSDDDKHPTLVTPGNFILGGGFKHAKPKTFSGHVPQPYILSPGDLVVTMTDLSRSGDTLGLPAIIPSDGRYLHNQRIGRVRILSPNRVSHEYLAYRLRLDDYRRYILETATGTTVRHTSPGRIQSFRLDLPSINVQKAVSGTLGALDDKIAANRHAATTTQDLCSALLDRVNANGAVPVLLADLTGSGEVVLGDGYRTRKDELTPEGGYAIVRAADVVDGQVRFGGADAVDKSFVKAMGHKIAQTDDVIVTTKGTIGRVARIATAPPNAVYSPQVCFMRVIDQARVRPAYLRTWLTSEEFTRQAQHVQHKTDMAPYISLGDLRSFRISIPSEGQRRRVYSELDALQKLDAAWQLESRTLAELRDTLLPHLMSGRLTVKAAESIVSDAV